MAQNKLTETKIAKLINTGKDGKYGDGNHLWLELSNDCANASWLYRYTQPGTRGLNPKQPRGTDKWVGLGSYNETSLDTARKLRDLLNSWLAQPGKDPATEWRKLKYGNEVEQGLTKTFREVAADFFTSMIAHKSSSHQERSMRAIRRWNAALGDWPIAGITTEVIREKMKIKEIWYGAPDAIPPIKKQTPNAQRILNTGDRIFRLAKARGLRPDNPAEWDIWQHIVARIGDVHTQKHYPAPDSYFDVRSIYEIIRNHNELPENRQITLGWEYSMGALGLLMVIHTGCRGEEVRKARCKEINLNNKSWEVPPEHLKMGHIHRRMRPLPITDQMMEDIIKPLQACGVDLSNGDAFLFRGNSKHGSMATGTMQAFLDHIVQWKKKLTVHGFRTSVSEWWDTKYPGSDRWRKIQLDQAPGGKIDDAYIRDTKLEERRPIMRQWSKFVTTTPPTQSKPVQSKTDNIVDYTLKKRRTA